MEQKNEYLARYDAVTGIPNRHMFDFELVRMIELAKRNNERCDLFFIDLDNFKHVNDTYGHDKGDLLLRSVATEMKKNVRSSDFVARLGGDEFGIILYGSKTDENVEVVADNILKMSKMEHNLEGVNVKIGVSIGIANFPGDAYNAENLIRLADEMMYKAKTSGKNQYQFYQLYK